ncbi:hypothetical protein Csa_017259, partial [Cucumis sativus]
LQSSRFMYCQRLCEGKLPSVYWSDVILSPCSETKAYTRIIESMNPRRTNCFSAHPSQKDFQL